MKKRYLGIILVVLLGSIFFPSNVTAEEDPIFFGDTIPVGTVIDHDVILFGDNILIEGDVLGNMLVIGNKVIVDGSIDGSLIILAQNVSLGGTIDGTVYAISLTVDLLPQFTLVRDLYAASVSITSGSDSIIGRHLYALGLDAGLNGTIGGELHTVLGPIQLYNGLMRLLGFEELTLQLNSQRPVPTDTSSGSIPLRYLRVKLLEPIPIFDWKLWGETVLHNWAVLLIFSLIVFLVLHRPLKNTAESIDSHGWKTLAIGLIVLVVAFNLFIVGFILFAIIFAIGLGINFLGLWPLTLTLWTLAFSALLISMVGLGLLIAYGSKIILIFFVFSRISSRIFHQKKIFIDLFMFLLGTIIYSLLCSIPYFGWIVNVLVTAAGLGAAWFTIRDINKPSFVSENISKTQQTAQRKMKKPG